MAYKMSEQERQRRSESARAQMTGQKLSEETRRKMAESAQLRFARVGHGPTAGRVIPQDERKMRAARLRNNPNVRPPLAKGEKMPQGWLENLVAGQHPAARPTSIELILRSLLSAYPDAQYEVNFGRYRVDAYIPSLHIAFEADGEYWHDANRDGKRDAYLMEQFGLPVVRFTGSELMLIGES